MDLDNLLHAVRRTWRISAVVRAAARGLLVIAAILAAAAIADRLLAPADGALLALGGLTLLLTLAAAVWCARPLRRRPDDRRIARFIEERIPELDDALVTAVEIRSRPDAAGFAPLVVTSAERRLQAIDISRVVDRARATSERRRLAVAAVVALAALVVATPVLERAAQVAYVRIFPGAVSVHVAGGDMRAPAGKPLTLAATVSGRYVALDRIAPVVTIETANGATAAVAMERAGSRYELRIPSLDRSFTYSVTAGPARSAPYRVTALFPPHVRRIELQYDYPAFTGLKPRQEPDGGDVYGPAGTRVRVVVHADKPVTGGRLAFADARPALALAPAGERVLESTLTLADEASYRVALVDADGLSSEGVEYFIRLMDDRPPVVHILRPSGDQQITPLDEVPIEARADDDYGIASLDMVYSIGGGPEKVVPFTRLGGTDIARIGSRMLAAEDLKVKPGDVIAYYARARDVARAKQSTLARSEIFFLEVKPFNEEYTLATSQAGMSSAAANQLEGLIASQKEIISATWNLERRSGAGKSVHDIKDLAAAQAELKARAEQAAGANRQRRRIGQPFLQIVFPPARAQEPAGDDPVRAAVEAMNRALQELQTQKTASAIPHEMAALNALLQAQAEVRKRQISQQQNNAGSGGGNRQSQDLSSLFDRELKRQQRTNYESKAQVETPPETAKADSALDRIRDLARRQEALSRQQRDLAKSDLTAEEKTRQLERLTREQERLRRDAERAERELRAEGAKGAKGAAGAEGAGAEGAKGAEGAGAEGAGAEGAGAQGAKRAGGAGAERAPRAAGAQGARQDLKEAMEQMRQATEQSQKSDADGAAAKAEEAARQLRQAESQMQNGTPDARRRALGDLQLESQQLAEAQRRVANEAARLDQEGGGTADARRRLAGDKERLAERVDALQQSAERLGSEAAGDLGSQKLADRMRESAKRMRDGKNGRLAPSEQQIAEALDRVARTLNGADAGGAKGETQQLANQLDEVRGARERLARLERQIADATQAAERGRQAGGRQTNGSQAAGGTGSGNDLQRLQQAYNQELQRTRELMDRVQRGTPASGGRMATPEQHEFSRSAPGTEAFKQDYAAWQSLAGDVARALERAEASVAGRLSTAVARDRLRAGGSERIPDAYRRRVSKYFESIAVRKQ